MKYLKETFFIFVPLFFLGFFLVPSPVSADYPCDREGQVQIGDQRDGTCQSGGRACTPYARYTETTDENGDGVVDPQDQGDQPWCDDGTCGEPCDAPTPTPGTGGSCNCEYSDLDDYSGRSCPSGYAAYSGTRDYSGNCRYNAGCSEFRWCVAQTTPTRSVTPTRTPTRSVTSPPRTTTTPRTGGYGWFCRDNDTIWAEHQNGSQDLFCDCSSTASLPECRGNACRAKAINDGSHVRDAECYYASASPNPSSGPTPPGSGGVTTHYRISETSFGRFDEDGSTPQWQQYTNDDGSEVVSIRYTLTNPAPGQEFTFFVQFKDINQTERNRKFSIVERRTIKFAGGDPVITSASCGFDPSGEGTLVTLTGSDFGTHTEQGAGEVKINGQSAEIISWTDEAPTPTLAPTSTPAPTVTPTPTPTMPPFTWRVNAEPVCSSGTFAQGGTRLFYALWPPNPLNWRYDNSTSSAGRHTQLISTTYTDLQNIYVGLEDEREQALQPIGTPPNPAITFAQYFDPLTWMAKWQRDQLPSGVYNLQFQAPQSWCSSSVLGVQTTRSRIVARVRPRLAGRIPLQLKIDDGRSTTATCTVNTTTVDFAAKTSCRPSGDFSSGDISLSITEAVSGAKPIIRTKVRLDKTGHLPADFAPVLEQGKRYQLVIKGPKIVARKVEFTTESGSNILKDIILPVGDIAPAGNPDGKINAVDKAELVREWSSSGDTAKPGDFNKDGRVNSLDWSCMRENINKEDEGTP